MLKKLSLASFGLALVLISQAWAGSTGNGTVQPTKPYAFCYAGSPKVVYVSQIITLAPTANVSNLNVAYADYIQKTYGIPSIDRQRCVTADSNAAAVNEKNLYKTQYETKEVINIQWAKPSPTQ